MSSESTDPRRVGRRQRMRFSEERLAGLSGGQTMLSLAGDFNAHNSVVEPGDEESTGTYVRGTRNMEW